MKYLFFCSFIISSVLTFAQSKKEVIAQNDSLKQVINQLKVDKEKVEVENKAYIDVVEKANKSNDTSKYVYLVGVLVGNNLSNKNFGPINYNSFYKGFYDGYNNNLSKSPIEYSNELKQVDAAINAKVAEINKKESIENLS